LESINPLHGCGDGEWREVYAVVRGTMVNFHKLKGDGAGRLLRSYTLQHAEVGLATDTQYTTLLPQTRLAHLIPSAARRRAWQKDPSMFNLVKQNVLRLRVETDQLLLADPCEDRIHHLVHSISAAIDIAQPIDDRSIPRQCTVPRRRRRQRPQVVNDIADPAFLAEQERIFGQMYPDFAGARAEPPRPGTGPDAPHPTPVREEDEVDLAAMREETSAPSTSQHLSAMDANNRPVNSRQTTGTTIGSTFSDDMVYATSRTNFDDEGKWHPPHLRTQAQVQRYIRRCMPILLAESVRASDIVVADGRRMKINWRMELLEEWELQPPAYKAHDFSSTTEAPLARTISQHSTAASASYTGQQSSSSLMASDTEPSTLAHDHLSPSKVASKRATDESATDKPVSRPTQDKLRVPGTQPPAVNDCHGVMFCF
jgi:hypothetical protein